MLEIFLVAMGMRFFIFDFYLFGPIRRDLMKISLLNKLLSCPFCQGFWCTLITLFVYHTFSWMKIDHIIRALALSFSGGYISFLLAIFTDKIADDWETWKEGK